MQAQITLDGLRPYLSFLGTFVQLGGTILLFALFALLRRYARRRKYFRIWSNAWATLAIALGSVVLCYNLLPAMLQSGAIRGSPTFAALCVLYQVSKLTFYMLVVGGTMRFIGLVPTTAMRLGAAGVIATYSLLSVLMANGLNDLVVWQAPFAMIALTGAATLFARLPASRRSLGSSICASFLALGAVLWAIYFTAFNADGRGLNALQVFVDYHSYLDLLWQLSLGFGMVVLLMEDVKHETDAAHAMLALAHDNLRRISFYDSVTGSLNRQAFADRIGLDAALAGFGAVMMLDMDDLKQINDRWGHAAGDGALRHLADVLRMALRPSDNLYRWGGDEFLLVLPAADAVQVARRVRTVLTHAQPFILPDGDELRLSVSLGGAQYASSEHMEDAIDLADRAMYADKLVRKQAAHGVTQPA